MASYAETALVRGLAFLSEAQASIAHNLANLDSAGFKRQSAVAKTETSRFQSVLEGELPTVGYSQTIDWTPGSLKTTAESTHVGIEGERSKNLFFRVRGKDNETYYTRNGQLQLDDQGRLVTSDGSRYLDASGNEISLGFDTALLSGILIESTGLIRERNGAGRQLGQIGVFKVDDTKSLSSVGSGLFRDTAKQPVTAAQTGSVRQGNLEQSNVQSLDEMVRMMIVERSFQATGRVLGAVQRVQESYSSVMSR
jgi:flagellar basal body rod protein FlgG